MTQSKRDRESGAGPTKVKPGRSRFSLRNILTQTNFLATGGPPPVSSSNRGKDSYTSFNKRHFIDSEVGLETIGSETSDNNMIAIDCYVEPQILPNGKYECPLCYGEVSSFPEISCCHHRACEDCWKEYLRIQITESRVNVSCFQCSKLIHPNDIKLLLNLTGEPGLMTKYEDFMIRRVLALEPDARWCPAPDCKFAVLASGCASCPRLLCERPGCNTAFCYHCKAVWHPNLTCDAARALRNTDIDLLHGIPITAGSKKLNSEGIREEIKPCPRCQVLICKLDDGSCNHMSCAVCGAEFCWLCMKEVSDLHYLSPSGCTFWGKKPWSRKKKLMWQLGTLVGAPVGIALVAGIAVPAMIIGIPVWVGRKIHHKMKTTARYKRNIAVGSGVLAGIVISPVLAGLAVGLGVPILLAYVYGVVPISLCRSGGGCGSSSEQDVFEDEDNESLEASNIITHKGITRLSIRSNDFGSMKGAQSIGDSNSVDRESVSIQALAGTSNNEHINKLEIQADVISTKRHSLSSESVCISLDTGSMKGLAGSVLSYNLKEVNLNEDSKSEASCQ